MADFLQSEWTEAVADDCRHVVRLAVREDLDRWFDLTTLALVEIEQDAAARVVARQAGVCAGLAAMPVILEAFEASLTWHAELSDGDSIAAHMVLGSLQGRARDLLTTERTILNILGRMCGIATLTRRYVDAVAGTGARIYDTRKTTPAWRRLEKYAVRCGGGRNHRAGLYDAVLIKDNHLAWFSGSPAEAVRLARSKIDEMRPDLKGQIPVEIEVDTLDQLRDVLAATPDIVLLDNMSLDELRDAVALRNAVAEAIVLEASGGVTLDTVRSIAETGVDRISVGALTHAATALDVGMDGGSTVQSQRDEII